MPKNSLVYCIHPNQYEIFDERINKPVWLKKVEDGEVVGSMVLQEMDEVKFKHTPFEFFAPNNVGILLSVSQKYKNEASDLFKKNLDPNTVDHSYRDKSIDKKKFLQNQSVIAADYIELIQISVVFAYTAVEAFANLSIPDEYKYEVKNKNKGVTEIYDKTAIERWIALSDKLSKILTDVYNTPKIESKKFWSSFKLLEKQRHNIIHQKSIKRTQFYKDYFKEKIFKQIDSAEFVLKYFYDFHSEQNKTNPLWPWSIGKEKSFPTTESFDSKNFEVIGNIHE